MASGIATATGGPAVGSSISDLHPDIIQTHILTRLDGLNLASIASTSSQLHALSAQERLWRDICTSTWPSLRHPRVRHVISTFPSGYRSFFSDSFPVSDHQLPQKQKLRPETITTELISAVDIYYGDNVIYSTVGETRTGTSSFLGSVFRVALVDMKESAPTRILNDEWTIELGGSYLAVAGEGGEELVDGEVQLRYSTIKRRQKSCGSEELVELGVVVTCGWKEGGEVQVREVSMQAEDMEGRSLNGRESLEILEAAMEGGRKKEGKKKEGKVRYREFLERKREKKELMRRKEGALDTACRILDMACVVIGAAAFAAFWNSASFW
ncbi:F-box protein At2g27310-like [Carica papaya]|uniref:F-box protein At2g27310-like n=1 Tax=Carica papaya TaxID=3649 RepID=UPI000B8CD439|nr:F-box protein At2g27310-like [Carica papaya]